MSESRVAKILKAPRDFWRGYHFAGVGAGTALTAAESAPPGFLENWMDERTEGPGIWKWRHYYPIYERHLAKFRGKEVHILEIGVYSGGSMQMWKDYFGDKARIYGVDIEPVCRQFEDGQTRIFIGDQADKAFWSEVLRQVPRIDVVVDDGGHRTEQQIATLEALLPNLAPGGVFICEDINGKANPFHSYVDGLSRQLHAHTIASVQGPDPRVLPYVNLQASGLQSKVDSIHTYPFMTVIEVRDQPVERLTSPKSGTEWKPTKSAPW